MSEQKTEEYIVERPGAELMSILKPLAKKYNAIIAGGVFKNILEANTSDSVPDLRKAKDVDLYFASEQEYERALKQCRTEFGSAIHESDKSVVFYHYDKGFHIDLVKTIHPDAKSVLDTFDFTVVKAAFYVDDSGDCEIMKHVMFDQHLEEKVLVYGEDFAFHGQDCPLERLHRYHFKYHFNITVSALLAALKYKVKTSHALSDFTVKQIISTSKKMVNLSKSNGSQNRFQINLPAKSPSSNKRVSANTVFRALLQYADTSIDHQIIGSRSRDRAYCERDFERSIVHAVKYGLSLTESNIVNDLSYAEQSMGVKIRGNDDVGIQLNATQVGFVDYLSTLNLSRERYETLVSAVFGHTGFIAKNTEHTLACSYTGEPVPMSHICNHRSGIFALLSRAEKYTVPASRSRNEDAEIMQRLLSMHDDAQWHEGVADYFGCMLTDDSQLGFLRFCEWEEAIKEGVFSPSIPFSLLYEIVKHPEPGDMLNSNKNPFA